MVRTATRAVILLAVVGAPAAADEARQVTFYKDVLPILQENCQQCHRHGGDNIAGMVAPMSLISYEEVRPWAKAIARNVSSGKMPPWFASEHSDGVFANERKLTDAEKAIILQWVNLGAPRGRESDAPPPLHFEDTDGWLTGKPDVIVKMPEPYFVADEVEDIYVNFVTEPLGEDVLPEDLWLKAIEWRGGSDVVHHIVGSYSVGESDVGAAERSGLGSIAPGEEGTLFPPGFGKLLKKGAKIHFNMHYHKEPGPGTGKWDQSMVGFQFWDPKQDPPVRYPVERNGISNHSFEIPPGHPNWEVGAGRVFTQDTLILSLHPHMHLRGKDARYLAYYPDGTTELLLHVPSWDFNWQLDYVFKDPKKVPAGTRVEFVVHYDNSTENIYNPDPTIPMGWGGPTTSEMMIGYITYTNAKPIDGDQAGTD